MTASSNELIDEHVSSEQCKKAIVALRNHALKIAKEKEDTELIAGKEENIWLVLTVKKTQPEKKLKPFKIPVAHPIVDPRSTPICLITKDPQREYKDLLATNNVKFISRVVGVAKLKGKFKPYEARRMLMKENGLFLADERVVPLLPGLLGKIFFEAKKQPIPVCLTRKDLKGELERAISSTYMHQNQGTCTSIKIGTISHSPAQLLDNMKTALPAIVKRIHGGWENIQSFNIKTNSSVSLPIWSCKLGVGEDARWPEVKEAEVEADAAGKDGVLESWTGFGGDAEEKDEASETSKKSKSKGKRKATDEDEVAPVKKSKSEKKTAKGDLAKSSTAVAEAPPATEKKSKKEKSTSKPEEVRKNKKADGSKESKEKKAPAKEPATSEAVDSPSKAKTKAVVQKAKDSSTDLTPADLKKKRSEKGIEKKKETVTKTGKTGKAKKEILGKSAKVRF